MTPPARRAAVPFVLVTVLLDVMGVGLIIPVLPALVGQFVDRPDAQAYWFGVLAASYGLMQFFAAPLLGALSDRFGRRPVLLVSVVGLGLDFVLQAVAGSLWVLLFARLVGGATGASFSVAGAYIADVTPEAERSRKLGLMGAAFGLGFIVGPVAGGLLGSHDLRLPFWVAAGLSLANALYGFFVLPESLPPERRAPLRLSRANPFSALARLARLHGMGALVAVHALSTLAQFMLHNIWVLYTQFRFGWGPRDNGLALFVVGLAAALVQGGLLGLLLARWGERRTVLVGLASGLLALTLYGLATRGWMMYAVIAASLLGYAVGPALQGLVSKSAGPQAQGVTMGALNAVASVAGVVAPLVAAPLLAQVTHLPPADWRVGLPFFMAAALQAIALAIAAARLRAGTPKAPSPNADPLRGAA